MESRGCTERQPNLMRPTRALARALVLPILAVAALELTTSFLLPPWWVTMAVWVITATVIYLDISREARK